MKKQGTADRHIVHGSKPRGHTSQLGGVSNSQQQNPQAQPGGPPMIPETIGSTPGQGPSPMGGPKGL